MDSDLTSFLEKHGRLYDSETDAYERPPFAADIKEGKNDPIYNAHSYHTKVPPRSIIPYILHYTKPGDVVLDPFCGSGMTGVAAQMCADPPRDILEQFPELVDRVGPRACILNDLSPAACHIAYNYNTPVDIEALKREFERIRAAVKEEFDWLYGTEHYEPAIGIYAPWQPEVASRLKNPPADAPSNTLRDDSERKWEVITRAEVERRLGYKVTALPHDEKWGNLDVSTVDHWICIPATIQYTIWSDVYRCEGIVTIEEPTGKISIRGKNAGKSITRKKRVVRGCGEEVVLWNVARDSADSSRFTCPKCGQIWQKVQVQRIRSIPVVTDLTHPKPSEGTRRLARAISEKERDLIAEIETKPLPHWVPSGSIDLGREMMRHGLLKRGVRTLADFYTKRNLWALSALWAEIQKIKDTRFRSGARFLITSFLPRVSRKAEYRTGGGAGNTHNINIPAIHREDNVMKSLSSKERDILSGLLSLRHFQSKIVPCIVSKRDATSLVHIHDDSIDYIFTDPPFGSNIFYADCSILWESWLGDFTDEKFEIVINERRQGGPFKKLEDYGNMMTSAIHEMYRVLKPGRWATIEFNNSDGAVFEAIKRGVRAAGFEIANMLLLDKQQKTFKQLQGADGQDVVDKDVLFNLHKLTAVQRERRSEDSDLEQQVADAVRDHLATLPARITAEPSKYSDDHRTTATINSMLMNTLIPRGVSVERLNLPFIERLCARYFRKIGQRWYLRGETVGPILQRHAHPSTRCGRNSKRNACTIHARADSTRFQGTKQSTRSCLRFGER
jgi:DNA modification methylase